MQERYVEGASAAHGAARTGTHPADQVEASEEQVVESSSRHVVPDPEGGWDVKKPGSTRAGAHAATQDAAVQRAREIVRNGGGGEVRIHGRDGRLRDSDTVTPGRDPSPPLDGR